MSKRPPAVEFALLRSASVPKRACSSSDFARLALFVLAAENASGPVELALDLTGAGRIHRLNRRFRGVDRPTDVISFRHELDRGFQGDIAINVHQAARQAREAGHSLRREIRLLWIHGLLHLMGYTDYNPCPRRRMFKRQNALLMRWERKAGS